MKRLLSFLFALSIVIPVQSQNNRADILEEMERSQGQGQQDQDHEQLVQQQSPTATLKSAVRLFGTRDDLTSVIMIIPSGSKVNILESDSTYYLVSFDNNKGYIFKRQAVIDSEGYSPVEKRQSSLPDPGVKTGEEERTIARPEPQNRFSYLENKYGTATAARINSGKIWKGMTAEMVRDSWGSPVKINRVVSGNTMKEEWTFRSTWLYFENNILMDWGPVKN